MCLEYWIVLTSAVEEDKGILRFSCNKLQELDVAGHVEITVVLVYLGSVMKVRWGIFLKIILDLIATVSLCLVSPTLFSLIKDSGTMNFGKWSMIGDTHCQGKRDKH